MSDTTFLEDMVKDIVQYDSTLLHEVSTDVTEFDEELQNLVEDMLITMKAHKGLGLAAVQIGVTKRVLLVSDDEDIVVMINPVFIRKLNRFTTEFEGCLSLPRHLWRNVSRPAKCEMTWQDMKGKVFTQNLTGVMARRVQHEMDHLDGILLTDHPVK